MNKHFLQNFGNDKPENTFNGKLINQTGLNDGLVEAIQDADDESNTVLAIKGNLFDVTSSTITDYDGRLIGKYV